MPDELIQTSTESISTPAPAATPTPTEVKKEAHVAPITLLQEQTQLLRDIKEELIRERHRIQREWWWNFLHEIGKYILIAAAVWYVSWHIQTAIQQVQGAIPQVPSVDFSKIDPRNLIK